MLFVSPRIFIGLLLSSSFLIAQEPPIPEPGEVRLPSGKIQREEILKSDHEKSLRDAADMVRIAEEFRSQLERDDRHVVSVDSIRKLEEIEKLAKRLRSRLKRY